MVYSYLFPICYLEHLNSMRLRHAKRLKSWVRFGLGYDEDGKAQRKRRGTLAPNDKGCLES